MIQTWWSARSTDCYEAICDEQKRRYECDQAVQRRALHDGHDASHKRCKVNQPLQREVEPHRRLMLKNESGESRVLEQKGARQEPNAEEEQGRLEPNARRSFAIRHAVIVVLRTNHALMISWTRK